MGGFRFSITTGFVVMTLVCVGLWAYVNQSDWAADITYTIYFCCLCLATGGALVLKDERRLFWLGFAIFGWAYWFVGFDVSLSNNRMAQVTWFYSGNQQPTAGPRLITSDLLDLAEVYLSDSRQVGAVVMAVWRNGGMYRGTIIEITDDGQYVVKWEDGSAPQTTPGSQVFPTKTHSRVAGHSVLGSLLALAGGIAVACLFGEKKTKPPLKPDP
jgi:hypothetical protein